MADTRKIAAVITVTIAIVIAAWLIVAHLTWTPVKPWPPEPKPYIELAQGLPEYIEPMPIATPAPTAGDLGDAALLPENSDQQSQLAPETGTMLRDAGTAAKSAKEVTSNRQSDVKAVKADKEAADRRAAEQRQAAARRTASKVNDAFARADARGNANVGATDQAQAGRTDGSLSGTGVQRGTVGGGWQFPAYNNRIATSLTGSITMRLTIDATGHVTDAQITGGLPPAANDAQLRAQCMREARSRRFTRAAAAGDAPAEARATLTFTFKN